MPSNPRSTRRNPRLAFGLPAILLIISCASDPAAARRRFEQREEAFVLIDEGLSHERQSHELLALERFNRASLIHESPLAFFRMGRLFELENKPEAAAAAYLRALELAPDYQEARFAMLALGFTPPGYSPTDADLALARQWAAEREAERAANAPEPEPPVPVDTAEQEARRAEVMTAAAERRLPTTSEVQAVLFAPNARAGALPSALDPTYASDVDVILGTYAYHYRKARQLRRVEQYDKAAEEFEEALRLDPTQIDARLELGDMYLENEQLSRARLHYEKAVAEFPESPRPYLKMGNYHYKLNDAQQAREFYRQALARDANFVEAYNNLAALAMREKAYDEARQLLDEAISIDPEYANAYLNRGIIADSFERDPEAAIRFYQRYVDLDGPQAPDVRRWIADLRSAKP